MARRRTSETAGPAAEAYAATLEREGDVENEREASGEATRPKAEQVRDVRGRFTRPRSRLKKIGRPKSGRRGPSYLANRSQEALVRMCVVLEHVVGRLEAEWLRVEWHDPVREDADRMKGIAALQGTGQRRRLAALTSVLVDMSEERIPRDLPKRHEEIASRMSKKLGEHFAWRTLYRKPYNRAWRTVDDALAKHAADRAATFADRSRWTKSGLTYRILKLVRRRDELQPLLKARLVEDTADEEGWDPIPAK